MFAVVFGASTAPTGIWIAVSAESVDTTPLVAGYPITLSPAWLTSEPSLLTLKVPSRVYSTAPPFSSTKKPEPCSATSLALPVEVGLPFEKSVSVEVTWVPAPTSIGSPEPAVPTCW